MLSQLLWRTEVQGLQLAHISLVPGSWYDLGTRLGPHVLVGPPRHSTQVIRPPDKLMWLLPKIWGEELWCTVELDLLCNLYSFVSQLCMHCIVPLMWFCSFSIYCTMFYPSCDLHIICYMTALHTNGPQNITISHNAQSEFMMSITSGWPCSIAVTHSTTEHHILYRLTSLHYITVERKTETIIKNKYEHYTGNVHTPLVPSTVCTAMKC